MATEVDMGPNLLQPGDGRQLRVITDLVTMKSAPGTPGGVLYETQTPPSGGCPPHVQRYDDETFYVLEGRYTFLIGEQETVLGPGGYVFVPRGTVHAFANAGAAPARMLVLATPGGIHEQFLAEVGDHAHRPAWEPDISRVLAVAPKYGISFVATPGRANERAARVDRTAV